MSLITLPRDILRSLFFYEGVGFVLCRCSKQLRNLLSNRDWYTLFSKDIIDEPYDKNSDYRKRFTRLRIDPPTNYIDAIHPDQICYLHNRSIYLDKKLQVRSYRHAWLTDKISKLFRDGKIEAIRAFTKVTSEMDQAIISHIYSNVFVVNETNRERSLEVVKSLIMNSKNLSQEWIFAKIIWMNSIQSIPFSFFTQLASKLITIEISSSFIYLLILLIAANNIDFIEYLLSLCERGIESIAGELVGIKKIPRIDGMIIELFRKHNHSIYSDDDMREFVYSETEVSIIETLLKQCIESTTRTIINDLIIKFPGSRERWSRKVLLGTISSDQFTIPFFDILASCGIYKDIIIPDPFSYDRDQISRQESILKNIPLETLYLFNMGIYKDIIIPDSSLSYDRDQISWQESILKNIPIETLEYLFNMGMRINFKKYPKLIEKVRGEKLEYFLKLGFSKHYKEKSTGSLMVKFLDSHSSLKILIKYGYSFPPHYLIEYLNKHIDSGANLSIVKMIIDGEDPNYMASDIRSLYRAIAARNKEVVSLLLESGVDPSALHELSGSHILKSALESKDRDIVALLVNKLKERTTEELEENDLLISSSCYHLHYSYVLRDICIGRKGLGDISKLMKTLVALSKHQSDLNYIDLLTLYISMFDGNVDDLFSLAISNNNLAAAELIKRILQVNVNSKGNDSYHIHLAIHNIGSNIPFFDIYRFLVVSGADINVVDDWGNSSLMIAVNSRCYPIISDLCSSMNNIYQENDDGITPMKLAIYNRDTVAVSALIHSGYDIKREENIDQFMIIYGTMEISNIINRSKRR